MLTPYALAAQGLVVMDMPRREPRSFDKQHFDAQQHNGDSYQNYAQYQYFHGN